MNHDIAHCTGYHCPTKKECLRYLAHLEAMDLNLANIAYMDPREDCDMLITSPVRRLF